jgi:hypothetical protein
MPGSAAWVSSTGASTFGSTSSVARAAGRSAKGAVADALQPHGGQPAGVVVAERAGDQSEGPLGLLVGQQVRAVLPVFGHAKPDLVGLGQGDQRVADPGQVRGPAVGLGEHHPGP